MSTFQARVEDLSQPRSTATGLRFFGRSCGGLFHTGNLIVPAVMVDQVAEGAEERGGPLSRDLLEIQSDQLFRLASRDARVAHTLAGLDDMDPSASAASSKPDRQLKLAHLPHGAAPDLTGPSPPSPAVGVLSRGVLSERVHLPPDCFHLPTDRMCSLHCC
jgi:hypothetical protein